MLVTHPCIDPLPSLFPDKAAQVSRGRLRAAPLLHPAVARDEGGDAEVWTVWVCPGVDCVGVLRCIVWMDGDVKAQGLWRRRAGDGWIQGADAGGGKSMLPSHFPATR